MKMLRTAKKSLRKCYMELKRSGLAETPEGVKVKRHWANVTRKMNELRISLKKFKIVKDRLRAETLEKRP